MCLYRFILFIIILSGYTWAGETEDSTAKAHDLDQLLVQLENRHGDLETLIATFEQYKYFSFMTKPIRADGFIMFSSPGKIRFEILKPYRTVLLDDGRRIRRYEYHDQAWHEIKFSSGKTMQFVMDQIGRWMQGDYKHQTDLFSVRLQKVNDPNDYAELALTPKPKQIQKYIESIHIHISGPPRQQVRALDIKEPGGDQTCLFFGLEQRNIPLPAEYFTNPDNSDKCMEILRQKKPPGIEKQATQGKDEN